MEIGKPWEPQVSTMEIGGYAFFSGRDSNNYNQLYKTDGTANGTVQVTNFSNGSELSEEAFMTYYQAPLHLRQCHRKYALF